jgi:hypothetical protein
MSDSEFPLRIEKCGVCGSKKTVNQLVTQQLEKQGKLTGEPSKGLLAVQMLLNPGKAKSLTATMMNIYRDICANCGIERVVLIELQDVPYTMVQQSQKGVPFGRMNPNFGMNPGMNPGLNS